MLFDPLAYRSFQFANRVVMAPMTRSRAIGNVPNALIAHYYEQRASAGLIVTEGVAPSPNGLGYARIPGLFSPAQVQAWRVVTAAVPARGGTIFAQLMHTGRVAHAANLPDGAEVLGPVATACPGQMWTDAQGMQPHTTPRAMTERDVAAAIAEFATAARNAREAGFDGIELHAANGYLIEQFLNANVNTRTDAWGGSADARNRFALEVARACADAIGAQRVGVRLSPYGVFNSTGAYPDVEPQYLALAQALSALRVGYLHVLDHSAIGAPAVPQAFKTELRRTFDGLFIAAGGFERASAERVLADGNADMVAFGRPLISNPDLVERMRSGAALAAPDPATFYTADAKGYTDYPALAA